MVNVDSIRIMLTVISGVCWTIVYIDGIRIGFRDKSYAIPFYALALNFAWELLYTVLGFRTNGVTVQNVFNAIWFAFDVGILYTYFKFGRKYFEDDALIHRLTWMVLINTSSGGAFSDSSQPLAYSTHSDANSVFPKRPGIQLFHKISSCRSFSSQCSSSAVVVKDRA